MKIVFNSYNSEGEATPVAHAWVGEDGTVRCDDAALLDEWTNSGIVGRFKNGRLFPKDGVAFMEELPYMYKSIYLHAEWE